MDQTTTNLGFIGITIGGIALLMALTHFWAGPFAPQPTIDTIVADNVSSIRDATIDAISGKERTRSSFTRNYDLDDYVQIATAIFGGIAIIFGVLGFAKKEPGRITGGAMALGIGAIVFQFVAMYAMALLVVLIICAVISQIGFDF